MSFERFDCSDKEELVSKLKNLSQTSLSPKEIIQILKETSMEFKKIVEEFGFDYMKSRTRWKINEIRRKKKGEKYESVDEIEKYKGFELNVDFTSKSELCCEREEKILFSKSLKCIDDFEYSWSYDKNLELFCLQDKNQIYGNISKYYINHIERFVNNIIDMNATNYYFVDDFFYFVMDRDLVLKILKKDEQSNQSFFDINHKTVCELLDFYHQLKYEVDIQ